MIEFKQSFLTRDGLKNVVCKNWDDVFKMIVWHLDAIKPKNRYDAEYAMQSAIRILEKVEAAWDRVMVKL